MRVHNISSNCYQRKQPAFKANVHAMIDIPCPHNICEMGKALVTKVFTEKAIKAGHVKPENLGFVLGTGDNNKMDLLLIDMSTSVKNKLLNIDSYESYERTIKEIKDAPDTVELPVNIKWEDICPELLSIKTQGLFN